MNNSLDGSPIASIAVPKKKRSHLPELTLLFVISYGLMTMLIIEQGAAIQSQSNLIKVLLPDSQQLWALKGKAKTDQPVAHAPQRGHSQAVQPQAPSNQAPAVRGPVAQSPSPSQKRADKARSETEVPPAPASDLLDQRRSLRTI